MTNDKMTKDINKVSVISDMGDGFFLVSTNGNLRRVAMNDTTLAKRLVELIARMDQFTSLEEGSTAGDAELADIRIGYDGQEYSTAGDAVREQARNLDAKKMPLGFSECVKAEGEEVQLVVGVDINVGDSIRFQYVARDGYSLTVAYHDDKGNNYSYTQRIPPADKDGMRSGSVTIKENETSLKITGAYFTHLKPTALEKTDEVSENDYMIISDGRGTYTIKMSVLKSFLGIDNVTQEMVDEAVNGYLKQFGIQPGATEAEAQQIQQNKEDIEQIGSDVESIGSAVESIETAMAAGKAGQVAVSDGEGGLTWVTITNGNEVAY